MRLWRTSFWALVFVFLLWAVVASARAGGPDPYLDFAHHLFAEGDYERAITEAKRFLFLHPEDSRGAEARFLIARAYFEAGDYDQARRAMKPVLIQRERPGLAAGAMLLFGESLEREGRLTDAEAYYRGLIAEPELPEAEAGDLRNRARYRLGWLLLERGRWAEAREVFEAVAPEHPWGAQARALAGRAPEGRALPHRSPTTAGVLSAVLPGAGQVYVGRPTDAALAFSLNAAFIWGTWEAYDAENWVVFTLLGLMELSWYGGNIYNAVNGAHRHNEEARERFLRRLRREHPWRLGYSPREQGLVLSWTTAY